MAIAEMPRGIEEQDIETKDDQQIETKSDDRATLQKAASAAAKEVKEMHSFGGEQFSADKVLEMLHLCLEASSEMEKTISQALEITHISASDEKLDYLDQIDYLKEEVLKFNNNPNLYRTQYDDKLTKLFEFCKTLSDLLSVESE